MVSRVAGPEPYKSMAVEGEAGTFASTLLAPDRRTIGRAGRVRGAAE